MIGKSRVSLVSVFHRIGSQQHAHHDDHIYLSRSSSSNNHDTMKLYSTITLFLLQQCTTVTSALDAWSGNMSYAFYPTSTDCSGAPLYFGYETAVKALEYGTFCVTDNQGGIDMYSKWVIRCETSATAPLPPGIYEFIQSCSDVDCQNCSEVPISAIQLPWSDGPPECAVARAFNATTTNPAEEFANMANGTFETILAPPSSESFGPPDASTKEFNEYFQYYMDNSCIGSSLPATNNFPGTRSSSSYVIASGNIMIWFGIFLSFQAYYVLMM